MLRVGAAMDARVRAGARHFPRNREWRHTEIGVGHAFVLILPLGGGAGR